MTAENRSPRAPPVGAGDTAASWESSEERPVCLGCGWPPAFRGGQTGRVSDWKERPEEPRSGPFFPSLVVRWDDLPSCTCFRTCKMGLFIPGLLGRSMRFYFEGTQHVVLWGHDSSRVVAAPGTRVG